MSEFLRISGAEAAAGVLIHAVAELGGTILPARLAGDDALPLDLSCGHGEPLLPIAAPGTASRVRLETMLPALLEEARVAVARAERLGRLSDQVEVDPLTGLLNRRAIKRLLPRLSAGDAVAVIDLDRFKALNDTHGHAAGDAVLTGFSRLLREQGRAEDHYGRLGGEEFLGIYPSTTVDDVARGLSRLRSQWSRVAPFPVTFCAGIAAVGADGGSAAVGEADVAMYAAKDAGRDRTVIRAGAVEGTDTWYAPQPRRPVDDTDGRGRALTTLLRHMASSDTHGATELLEGLYDDGATLGELTALLSAAQDEVGRRWQSGAWSVADEHRATAVADIALATIGGYAKHNVAALAAPRVAIACPEGEWHQLPARMLAVQLLDLGINVTVFGPSLPAPDLQRALTQDRPTALVLSCTMAAQLPSAETSIRAAHECAVPVLVGGRAFGDDPRRAERIAADAWAADVGTAAALVYRWQEHPPALRVPAVRDYPSGLVAHSEAEQAILDRVVSDPPTGSSLTPAQLRAAREDVRRIVDHVNAALILDDAAIVSEFTEWRNNVLAARHLAPDLLPIVYRAVDEVLCADNPRARHQLRLAIAALAGSKPFSPVPET